jgi:hypothetical protein
MPPDRHACRPCPVSLPDRLLLPFENSGWPQILELVIVRQGPRIAVDRSAALQRVRGACRRSFVLVAQLLFSQVPKFSFSTFGAARLLPKLIRSRVDFLFAGFSHDVFSELEHGPSFRRVDLPASDSSPPEAVSSSPRLPPQDKGQAGVTPRGLCRDCPAPREDSVSGNITANRQKRSGRRGSFNNPDACALPTPRTAN